MIKNNAVMKQKIRFLFLILISFICLFIITSCQTRSPDKEFEEKNQELILKNISDIYSIKNESLNKGFLLSKRSIDEELIKFYTTNTSTSTNQLNKVKTCFSKMPETESEKEFYEKITNLKTEQEILDFATQNFKIINEEQTLKSAVEAYLLGEGSKHDFFRLTAFTFMFNCHHASIIVYEYKENQEIKYEAVLVYTIGKEAKYLYYENNLFHTSNAGSSFEELISMEEQRLNININKYGAIVFNLITNEEELKITDTAYWVNL